MAFLSNFTARMLDAALARSGLQGFFEAHLTTDRVRAFKPDRRAYQMGIEAFECPGRRSCSARQRVGMWPGRSGLAIPRSGSIAPISRWKHWARALTARARGW